jgi:hypothetical protein
MQNVDWEEVAGRLAAATSRWREHEGWDFTSTPG